MDTHTLSLWIHEAHKIQKDGRQFRLCRDAAVKSFRSQIHARVNQFDVQSRLEGLQEKFFVLNNEPLATALATRLDELSLKSPKWRPEILSLFLSLSDCPVEKTDVYAVDQIINPEPTPQLTWAEIIADDPLTEEGIWDGVVIESDFSEDDNGLSDESEVAHTTSTKASSLGEDDSATLARSYIASPDRTILDDIRAIRQIFDPARDEVRKPDSRLYVPDQTAITELQATREALLMLHGLASSVFGVDDSGSVQFRPRYGITSVASSTFSRVMHDFAELGSRLSSIRQSGATLPTHALLQRAQASMQTRLRAVDKSFSDIEQRFIAPGKETVVSLISVLAEVHRLAKPLLHAGQALSQTSSERPHEILDFLFLTTCNLQLIGDDEDCAYVATVFFECLEIYLKPIQLWVTQGRLRDSDDTFLVRANDSQTDMGSLWHTHFSLRECPDGTVNAPSFMQAVAQRIFQTGKSVMFLGKLGQGPEDHASSAFAVNVGPIIQSIEDGVLPFSEVFSEALQHWIAGLGSPQAHNLHKVLSSKCGLDNTIQAIDHIFLSRDGARFQHFADGLFARIDAGKTWNDRFLLTEAAQESFGSLVCVEKNRISARALSASDTTSDPVKRILLSYTISWPLQNIIREDTPSMCQQTFTKLLRVYRAEYLLTKDEWMLILAGKGTKDKTINQILALRQRLLWFVSTLRSYLTEMASLAMRCLTTSLDKALDVDGMVNAYADFQRILAEKVLLTSNLRPISQALFAILDICEEYAAVWTDSIEKAVDLSGDSTSRDAAVKQKESLRKPRTATKDTSEDFSDEDTDEDLSKPRQISSNIDDLTNEYERQLSFAIAGLRGVSRAGGEPAWNVLAERLQWGMDSMDQR